MKRRKRTGIISMLFLGIALILSGCGGGGGTTPAYSIGGTVSGLSGTLVQNNDGDDLAITSDGTFTFSTALADGSGYNVTVKTQQGQSCFVTNGSGTVSGADVTDVTVDCSKAGTLDKTFGENGNGIVTYNPGGYNYVGNSITTDADGKILVTGYKDNDMTIWRYKKDGTLDATFDYNSYHITNRSYGPSGKYGPSITTDTNNKILVTGSIKKTSDDDTFYDMAIWRYNKNGSLDTYFNRPKGIAISDGTYTDTHTDLGDYGISITTDTDGNILVAGSRYGDMAIWKYKTDGTPDTTFSKGIATYRDEVYWSSGNSITTAKDGKVLVTGFSKNDMAIWRYKKDGTLDQTFGKNKNGFVTYNSGGSARGNSITTDADGKILVTGFSKKGMAIWRYIP